MYEDQFLKISDRPSYIGMIISLPFILVNFIIYVILPLKHGRGRQLLCFLFSLFNSYLFFAISGYMEKEGFISSITCTVLAVLTLYFTFATYAWASVICFDMWMTIRDVKGMWEELSMERRTRFWYYTAFSWNVPLLILILIISISKTVPLNTWYNPGLSDSNCWLNDGVPQLIYFITPLLLGIIADIIFVSLTLHRIKTAHPTRTERHKMVSKFYSRFRCLGILLVSWILDIVVWALKWKLGYVPTSWWYAIESYNGVTGILILLSTIVFDRNMRRLTARRFLEFKQKRYALNRD